MKFANRDEIPELWGNPDKTKPRWVTTRYVPWTSWLAGAQQWGLSSVRQGESSGTITHELGHSRLQRRRQQQQSVRHAVPPRRHRTVGHDGPRLLQWSRRSASALGRACRGRRVDAGRPDAAQPARHGRDAARQGDRVSRDALASSGPVVVTLIAAFGGAARRIVGRPHRAARRRRAAGPDAGLRSQRRSAVRRRSGVQRLLGRSRAAHRLRLVHAGQRRAPREEQG